MARYFFNIHKPDSVATDHTGLEFTELGYALDEAKAVARDVALQYLDRGLSLSEPCIEITDDAGRVVAALSVGEVLAHPYAPEFKDEC